MTDPDFLTAAAGHRLAFHRTVGKPPHMLWLGGFASDMDGSKALALEQWARSAGAGYTRFDYFGHGRSEGRFEDGSISRWAADAQEVIAAGPDGPLLLVGSSMGGWIALLTALAQPQRVAGMVLIAPAPDFTEVLMWDQFPGEIRTEIETEGRWLRPTEYDPAPQPITKKLIEDGRRNLLLNGPVEISCPVRILHGLNDADVPWAHGYKTAEALTGSDVTLTLVKGGDHRLSTPSHLKLVTETVAALHSQLAG